MLIAPNNETNAIMQLIAAYCQGRKGPSLGTKVEQARDEGRADGWRNGVAEALGYWLSVKRRDSLPHSRWVELITDSDVSEALAPYVERFHEARNAPKPKEKDVPSEFELFMTEAYDALMQLVVTEEQRRLDDEARRELILKGEAEPTEDDADWIDQIRDEAHRRLTEFDKLATKVRA